MLGIDRAQLDLQPGPLPRRVVQRPAGVGQLGLVGRLQAGDLAATHLLPLSDLQLQGAVLQLQAPHLVDVNGQAVVQLPQYLLLLQPGEAGRALRHDGR